MHDVPASANLRDADEEAKVRPHECEGPDDRVFPEADAELDGLAHGVVDEVVEEEAHALEP